MFKIINIFLFGIILANTYAQEFDDFQTSQDKLTKLLGLKEESPRIPEVTGKDFLISSIDEEEYIIDAGDVFILKIDVKGPAVKVFNSIVTPAGYIIIPDAPTIYVRYLSLKRAREKIVNTLKHDFPQAKIEAHLFNLHQVGVDVLGALPRPSKILLNSGNRLFDAITYKLSPLLADTTIIFNWNTMSLRNVEIRRKQGRVNYDLLDYRLTGNLLQNPYIMDGDIIFINFRDSLKHSVSVRGAVGQAIDFEYRYGDDVKKAIDFAAGFLPFADSSRIELIKSTQTELKKKILTFENDADLLLEAGDRLFVREKVEWVQKASVLVQGQVRFPGEYAIISGKTRLADIILQCGGFTEKASLASASVIRQKDKIFDKDEIKRLSKIQPLDMSELEVSYFRQRSRENKYIVNCDFVELFKNENESADIVLFDSDIIIVPENKLNVSVTGGVTSPGRIQYHEGWTYENYIDAAGGYTNRARTTWTKIIDGKSGKWLDADDDIVIKDGDIIFVPEREDIDWYEVFKEGLTIVSQVATVILIIASLNR